MIEYKSRSNKTHLSIEFCVSIFVILTIILSGPAIHAAEQYKKQGRDAVSDIVDGVILISADRHRSDAWKIERENGYDLYEFESSKLTNIHTHKIMLGALFGYNQKCSFGLLTFDTTKTDP